MTMFSKLSIRKSLIGGFLFCAALTTFLGGTGIFSLLQTKEAMKNTVGKVVTNADLQNSRIRHLIPIRKLVSRIIETNEMENLSKLNDDLKIIEKNIKKVNSDILILINELMAFKEQYISLNHSFEQSKNQNISYLKSISQLSNTSVTSTMDESISAIEIETESIMGGVAELISVGRKSGPSVNLNTDDIISKAGINDMVDELLIVSEMSLSSVRAAMTIQAKANFLLVMLDEVENSSDLKSLEQVSEKIFKIKGEINSEIVELPDDQTTQKIVEQLIVLTKTIDTMFKAKKVVIDTSIKFNNKSKDILLLISGVESKVLSDGKTLTDNVTATMADVTASVGKWLSIQIILVCVVVILALFIGLYLSGSISKSLNRVIQGLSAEAGRVKEVSSQVALAGQSLAEASSEQAASIEETSSSMEEMASMTRKNAQNASQADSLMKKTNQVVAQSNASMSRLTRAMEDISNASEETSKIIKTIDEIAFRTNLLALNAAVEAARAGEAGAGFAVVADEVRTLAMQAADAAKDTARLIKSTVGKVHDGFESVASTNKAFEQVAGSAGKVGDLVAQISEASNEQSIGIEQVNNAITEMDKVVQQNASAAEESASAAEDMSAYAGKLKNYVQDLAALVTGKHEKKIPDAGSAEVKPNQMISFNADEFETF